MMATKSLTPRERRIILECLKAAAEGPFFPDWEVDTLLGFSRNELKSLIARWDTLDLNEASVQQAINNCLINLLGHPHGHHEEWSRYISVDPDELSALWESWRAQA